MSELTAQAERELAAIDDRAITLAADRAVHEEELGSLMLTLETLVDAVAPRFVLTPVVSVLVKGLPTSPRRSDSFMSRTLPCGSGPVWGAPVALTQPAAATMASAARRTRRGAAGRIPPGYQSFFSPFATTQSW